MEEEKERQSKHTHTRVSCPFISTGLFLNIGPTLITSFNLNHLLKRPISEYILKGIRPSIYESGENPIQSFTGTNALDQHQP